MLSLPEKCEASKGSYWAGVFIQVTTRTVALKRSTSSVVLGSKVEWAKEEALQPGVATCRECTVSINFFQFVLYYSMLYCCINLFMVKDTDSVFTTCHYIQHESSILSHGRHSNFKEAAVLNAVVQCIQLYIVVSEKHPSPASLLLTCLEADDEKIGQRAEGAAVKETHGQANQSVPSRVGVSVWILCLDSAGEATPKSRGSTGCWVVGEMLQSFYPPFWSISVMFCASKEEGNIGFPRMGVPQNHRFQYYINDQILNALGYPYRNPPKYVFWCFL